MGRRKIPILPIASKRSRANTYKKRRPGLFKKAHELAVLCNKKVFVYIVDDNTGSMHMFGSTDETFYPDYTRLKIGDRKGPRDFTSIATSRKKAKAPEQEGRKHDVSGSERDPSVSAVPTTLQMTAEELSRRIRLVAASISRDHGRCFDIFKIT
jgi:hypothetical protein